ncbi:hypothetical protein V500_03400 [Pseudogymnoascus sp. VKM F-4518 (FW-2643)]|nr:hypothetical protein V500_03400 [Pseudogymnoascus sp. VKM F-4518 (FW-2643)]
MTDELPFDGDPIADFKAVLASHTKKATCGRSYVLVSKLRLWLKSNVPSGGEDRNQASRLLAYAYRSRENKPSLPITPEVLTDSHNECLLVFCILLELGRGHLVHRFYRRNKLDKHLPIPLESLRDTAAKISMSNLNEFVEGFDKLQWKFCPAIFEMGMGREFQENEVLPFCKKEEINKKGATAQLWQIEIPEEFVGLKLRAVVKDEKYDDPNDGVGPRYNFALKIFDESNKALFETERDAFLALRHEAGMVRYLGDYEHVEVQTVPTTLQTTTECETSKVEVRKISTCNIIMEYGDYDLDEYFREFAPPVFQSEINFFWTGLFEVAYAVENIHHFTVNKDGRMEEFHGWHADITPDNILIVQERFKLADLGFAKFVKTTQSDPEEFIYGGTETYGAPERHPSGKGRIAVPQTIDIWSLGCVFSIAATWAVLGFKGIQQFTEFRQRAIRNIVQGQPAQSTSSGTTPILNLGDYFHNGKEVLGAVLSWHTLLRSVSRKNDFVTSRVLDIIDEMIFVGDARRRIKAKDLCMKLDEIKIKMQTDTEKLPKDIMEMLLGYTMIIMPLTYLNHWPRPTCTAISKAYKDRLDELDVALLNLFIKEDEVADVPFPFERRNILNDAKLKDWIGDQSSIDPLAKTESGELATKPDPKCRFIFIHASNNSRKPIRITRKMMVRILSYHQVMPGYLDFLFSFGGKFDQRDFRFSAFAEQTLLNSPARGPAVVGLGRCGRQFQLSFNLKGVSCIVESKEDMRRRQWSLREVAIHHQFDIEFGTTLWIITKGNLEFKERIQDMTGQDGRPEDRSFGTVRQCFISSLAVHLLLCQWSREQWRWYMLWLEEVISEATSHVHLPRGPGEYRKEYSHDDFQNIQVYEDRASHVAMILEANSYVLESLRTYYMGLLGNSDFTIRDLCREEIVSFCSQIDNMIQNSRMEIARAKVLIQIASARRDLVLQFIQSQGTEKMERLTISMHQMGDLSRKEAVAMRIVTVVTLIYLPATFVSTLFSTDIVKYQDQGNGGTTDSQGNAYVSFSGLALSRWFQVTLPLTAITLSLGYWAFKMAEKKRERFEILPNYALEKDGMA